MSATNETTVQVTVWVLVDEDGNYVANTDGDTIHELYDSEVGNDRDTTSLRRVKVTLTVPKPRTVELVGTVAAEPAAGELRAA